MVQGVIVAAGSGSRLYPVTDIVPKFLLPIGYDLKPMGQLVLEHCKEHGITDFVFCLNAQTGKQIYNYFGDGARFGVSIEYSMSNEGQGTSGEVRLAYDRGLIKTPALIYYGDTLCRTNLTEMMSIGSFATVVVNKDMRMPYGFVEANGGYALRVIEKPTISEMIPESNVGAIRAIYYVQNPLFWDMCRKDIDISRDILPKMLKMGAPLGVYQDTADFLDVGDWKNYGRALKWK